MPVLCLFITASLILKENKSGGGEIAALMVLLLFDEVARIETWRVYLALLFKIFHPAQTHAPPFSFLLCYLSFQVRQSQHSAAALLPAAVAHTQVNRSLFRIMGANYSRLQILFFHSKF